MLTRRTLIASAALLPAALLPAGHALAATTPAPALPPTVKSHPAPYPTFGSIERLMLDKTSLDGIESQVLIDKRIRYLFIFGEIDLDL